MSRDKCEAANLNCKCGGIFNKVSSLLNSKLWLHLRKMCSLKDSFTYSQPAGVGPNKAPNSKSLQRQANILKCLLLCCTSKRNSERYSIHSFFSVLMYSFVTVQESFSLVYCLGFILLPFWAVMLTHNMGPIFRELTCESCSSKQNALNCIAADSTDTVQRHCMLKGCCSNRRAYLNCPMLW